MLIEYFMIMPKLLKSFISFLQKAFHAFVSGIVSLMAKDFTSFVLLSCFGSLPVAWWVINKLKEDYYYIASRYVWILFIALGVSLLIALLILSIRTIRSAFENPVRSLRSM